MANTLTEPPIGEGSFGKVFLKDNLAIKVFKRPPTSTEQDLDPVDINDETNRIKKNSKVKSKLIRKPGKLMSCDIV
jgi:hypothetical protein